MRYHEEYEGYPLGEVARRIGKEENDILRMAAGGEFGLWIWRDSLQTTDGIEKPGWFKVNRKDVGRFISRERIIIESVDTIDGRTIYPAEAEEDVVVDVIPATLGQLNQHDRFTGSERQYFGLEEEPPEIVLERTNEILDRNSLNVLLQDFEKLTAMSISQNENEVKKNIDRGILLDTKKSIAKYLNTSESTLTRKYITVGGDHANRKGRGGQPLMNKIGKQWAAWTDDLDYHKKKFTI